MTCRPHGLRKTLGRLLPDAGVSTHDIMAASATRHWPKPNITPEKRIAGAEVHALWLRLMHIGRTNLPKPLLIVWCILKKQ